MVFDLVQFCGINFKIPMDVVGFLAAIGIGISLGLIGGGGSILTVPVLVYLFHVNPVLATTYSLFIVGSTSVVGSVSYFKKGLVNLKMAVIFGIPSILAVFLTRTFVIPAIPNEVFSIGNFTVTKSILLLLLFAFLMMVASHKMIRKCPDCNEDETKIPELNFGLIFFQGTLVGFTTGLIGAGGGFLIIPALVNLLKLPMKTAIGTSLLIIAVNSLSGFLFSLPHTIINWNFLLMMSMLAMIGIFIGMAISKKIDGKKLKPAFGWFVLIMGIYIIIKETFLK